MSFTSSKHTDKITCDANNLSENDLWFIINSCTSAELFDFGYKYLLVYLDKPDFELNYNKIWSIEAVIEGKLRNMRVGWKSILDFQSDLENYTIISKEVLEIETDTIEAKIKEVITEILAKCEKLERPDMDDLSTISVNLIKANLMRYLCEIENESDFDKTVTTALEQFNSTFSNANNKLEKDTELFLKVSYSFALFYYNILDEKKRAISVVDNAYREAANLLEENNRENAVDEVLKSIEEILTIWKISEMEME